MCITIIDTIIHNYTQLYTIIQTKYTNNAYTYDTYDAYDTYNTYDTYDTYDTYLSAVYVISLSVAASDGYASSASVQLAVVAQQVC
jgi:hypothetical protein